MENDSQCPTRKKGFKNKGGAILFQKDRTKRCRAPGHPHKDKRREVAKLHVFRCEFCQLWHIGAGYRPKPKRGKMR